jgi:hypothetical protein
MTFWNGLLWVGAGILAAGAIYCFQPLGAELWDTLKHRRYMARMRREQKEWEQRMSESWRRDIRYNTDGDKVA